MMKKLCCIFWFCTLAQAQQAIKIETSDIKLFYNAFDLALQDTVHATAIFDAGYFKKGSKGLRAFYKYKIQDKEKFSATILAYKDFYRGIRPEMLNAGQFEAAINENFTAFKAIYPQAKCGKVYFLMGRLTSNGTISGDNLLIGTEILSKTETNATRWPEKLRNWTLDYANIPITVLHEVVHINQGGMKREPKLLSYALREGAAEFLTALVTGKTDGDYNLSREGNYRFGLISCRTAIRIFLKAGTVARSRSARVMLCIGRVTIFASPIMSRRRTSGRPLLTFCIYGTVKSFMGKAKLKLTCNPTSKNNIRRCKFPGLTAGLAGVNLPR